ncbi:MAG: response regulator transcription factor [Phycisphaerales bacterium]|nr:response regulator transcription factor [Phycisphaerales bacterium]
MPTVLVIEDDSPIRRGVCDALRFAGHEPIEAADAVAGLAALDAATVDLVLLDVMLPKGLDGFEALRRLRSRDATLPVIMLTARGSEGDRVRGLEDGADDYVIKPFSARELLARIDAVLRRSPQRSSDAVGLDGPGVAVCLLRREVRVDDGTVRELTDREAGILGHLASNHGRAVHRDELLRAVWGLDPRGLETRTVDMQVLRLREKLAPAEIVVTVRGVGYKLAEDVKVRTR